MITKLVIIQEYRPSVIMSMIITNIVEKMSFFMFSSSQGIGIPFGGKNDGFLIRNILSLVKNTVFLINDGVFLIRNKPFLVKNPLFLGKNRGFLIRNVVFLGRNGVSLGRHGVASLLN